MLQPWKLIVIGGPLFPNDSTWEKQLPMRSNLSWIYIPSYSNEFFSTTPTIARTIRILAIESPIIQYSDLIIKKTYKNRPLRLMFECALCVTRNEWLLLKRPIYYRIFSARIVRTVSKHKLNTFFIMNIKPYFKSCPNAYFKDISNI